MKGTVKWFNPRTGYGFISGEDGDDYFVHYTSIQSDGFRTLREKTEVDFDANQDENGRPVAKNVMTG